MTGGGSGGDERTHAAPPSRPTGGRAPDLGAISGQRIGRFQLVRELGRGGFGAVYEAVDTSLGRSVALKVLRSADARVRERTLREGRIASGLSHPHIVGLHEVGEEDGLIYLVYRLVRGQTLAELAPLPPAEAARLVKDVARAVTHAHAKGALHRDVKPSNVLIEDATALLTDFGIGALEGDVRLTRTGEGLGTVGFAAPEQLGGRVATERSDVYGLGATLYHALTGRPPWAFEEEDLLAMFRRAVTPPSAHVAVPPALEAIVLRCLELDPARRQARARDVVRELEAYLATDPRGRGRGALGRASTWLWALAAVALVIALAWRPWGPATAPPQPAPPSPPRPTRPGSAARPEGALGELALARSLAQERRSFQDPLDAYERARRLAAGDAALATQVEEERLAYLLRRGRYEDVAPGEASSARAALLGALARERLGRGDADVRAALARARDLDGDGPVGVTARALLAQRDGDAAAGLALLDPPARAREADPYLLLVRGRLLAALGRRVEAVDALRRARAGCGDEPLVLGLLGELLLAGGDAVGALAALDEAVTLTEPEPDHGLLRARTLLALREGPWAGARLPAPALDGALEDLDRLLARAADDPAELTAWRGLVKLLLRGRSGVRGAPAALERPPAEDDWRAARQDDPAGFARWVATLSPDLREVIGAAVGQ